MNDETIDKNGAPGVSYVKNVRDFGPIIVITRDGKIISAYDTNQKYINSQIKKGKVIYDGSKS